MKYRDVKEYYRIIIIEYTNEIENESNLKTLFHFAKVCFEEEKRKETEVSLPQFFEINVL